MKAVLCKQHGGPHTLVVEDVPPLQPGPGDVVVSVHAAAVTPGELAWDETWPGGEIPENPAGFGSRLIRLTVQQEFGGEVERRLGAGTAHYRLRIPVAAVAL